MTEFRLGMMHDGCADKQFGMKHCTVLLYMLSIFLILAVCMEIPIGPTAGSPTLDPTRMSLEDMEDLLNDPSKKLVGLLKTRIANEVISRNKRLKECFDILQQLKQDPSMTFTENSGINVVLFKYSKVKTIAGRFIMISVREAISTQCWKLQKKHPQLHRIVWRLFCTMMEELEPVLMANKDADKCHISSSFNVRHINNPFYHEEGPN